MMDFLACGAVEAPDAASDDSELVCQEDAAPRRGMRDEGLKGKNGVRPSKDGIA